ncbi:hypothetical protein BJ508DRAFT_321772 [Ascobolus immersus RN42]|uniref:Uncharacterized protein n=1 Tax=Ascobolus immersus RN42 TaxID=1160509 RepID=A0A3N4ILT6_ASCIM|nr:hypothetical protein BJ508DRAFT_321772 [Ascobolus immersus RN42]
MIQALQPTGSASSNETAIAPERARVSLEPLTNLNVQRLQPVEDTPIEMKVAIKQRRHPNKKKAKGKRSNHHLSKQLKLLQQSSLHSNSQTSAVLSMTASVPDHSPLERHRLLKNIRTLYTISLARHPIALVHRALIDSSTSVVIYHLFGEWPYDGRSGTFWNFHNGFEISARKIHRRKSHGGDGTTRSETLFWTTFLRLWDRYIRRYHPDSVHRHVQKDHEWDLTEVGWIEKDVALDALEQRRVVPAGLFLRRRTGRVAESWQVTRERLDEELNLWSEERKRLREDWAMESSLDFRRQVVEMALRAAPSGHYLLGE